MIGKVRFCSGKVRSKVRVSAVLAPAYTISTKQIKKAFIYINDIQKGRDLQEQCGDSQHVYCGIIDSFFSNRYDRPLDSSQKVDLRFT